MDYICTFCKSIFKNSSLLKRHMKTAKYCLSLRPNNIVSNTEYKCNGCMKIFTNKQNMISHLEICHEIKIKSIQCDYDNEIKNIQNDHDNKIKNIRNDYENKIKNLEEKLEMYKSDHECVQEIAKQPRISNTINNKYLNITPFIIRKGDIERKVKNNFTEEMFLDGQQGIADFTYNNILKDDKGNSKYICNDINRGNFSYKVDNGEIKTDFKADKLINMIYKPVVEKSEIHKNNIISKNNNFETKSKCLNKIIEIKESNNVLSNNKFRNRIVILNKRNEKFPVIEDAIVNDLIPIDYNYFLSQSQFLTEEHIKNGVKGYVEFAVNYSFKDRVCCQNNILIYKKSIEEDTINIEENNGVELCVEFFKSIEKQNRNLFTVLSKKISLQIRHIEEKSKDEKECEILDNLFNETEENYRSISDITLCLKNNFLDDFITCLCGYL